MGVSVLPVIENLLGCLRFLLVNDFVEKYSIAPGLIRLHKNTVAAV